MKKTPLNQTHIDAGARMVDFGGWHMPVQYTGLSQEHQAVRTKAGKSAGSEARASSFTMRWPS